MPRGRTKDELERAAVGVRVREAIREYRSKSDLPEEFSYSLETRRFYEADKLEDRIALLEHHGDGNSPLYLIAMTNTKGPITDEHAIHIAEKCARRGQIPFIGRWTQNGELYEDVSIALNHGITAVSVKRMLTERAQVACMVINRMESFLLYTDDI